MLWKMLAVLLIGSVAACAGAPQASHRQPIPAQYQPAVSQAEKLGRTIYEYDRAAWVATDGLFERLPEARNSSVRGWIVAAEGSGWRVSFVSHEGLDDLATYSVNLDHDFKVIGVVEHRPPAPLASDDLAMYRARQLALHETQLICQTSYNTVVLPASLLTSTGWLVYLLPASTVPGEQYLGHHRVFVDQAGTSIVRTEALSTSCLRIRAPAENVASGWVTHLISPTPIEIHVVLNLAMGKPLYVGAGGDLWLVTNGTIAYYGALK